jgi:hypothetical protein
VTCIVGNRSHAAYDHLVNFSVPALFGYFSSAEFLDSALKFYTFAIASSPPDLLPGILKPLFVSASLFPFFESIIPPYLDMFLPPRALWRSGPDVDIFLNVLSLRAALIPRTHRILWTMLAMTHGLAVAAHFFCDVIRDFALIFLRARRAPCPTWVDKFSGALRRHARCGAVLDEAFGQSSHAAFAVPDVFDQYAMYVMSVSDAALLVDCGMRAVERFPRSLAAIASRFGALTGSEIFTLKMFAADAPVRAEQCALFFASADRIRFEPDPAFERAPADSREFAEYAARREVAELQGRGELFEDYLQRMVTMRVGKKWLGRIAAFEFHVFLPVAYETVAGVRTANVEGAFRRLPSPFPRSRRLWREQFFALAESNISVLLRDQAKNLKGLVGKWVFWAKEFEKSINMSKLFSRSGAVNVFCRCIDRLRGTNSDVLSSSFTIVTKVARVIECLARKERHSTLELFKIALVMSQSNAFPAFYLIMAHGVVNSECFEQLCSQRELTSWLLFQQMMLNLLSVHTQFCELFLTIRDGLNRPLLHMERSLSVDDHTSLKSRNGIDRSVRR